MFFYLLYNSTLIEKELDEYNRSIKVLIYGSIAYIVLHAVLFIGGEDALLYSLKVYFWLFLLLDGIVLFLMFNRDNKNKNIFEVLFPKKKKVQKDIIYQNQNIDNSNPSPIIKKNNSRPQRKKVKFDIQQYESSDSDSDIGTDIDLASFRESLME